MFPLSNWTELDIWHYIAHEDIPVVPLYFAAEREVVVRGGQLHPGRAPGRGCSPGERAERMIVPLSVARLLSLHRRGRARPRAPCRRSSPSSRTTRYSERVTRVIDHDQDGSMEQKKREGYF